MDQYLPNVIHTGKPIQFYDEYENFKKIAKEKGIKLENLLDDPKVPILSGPIEPAIGQAPPMQFQVITIVAVSMVAVFLGLTLWRWPQQIPRSSK